MDDLLSNIPKGLGLYLEIGVGVLILLFLLFGMLKNWKFSLIQIVLFIVGIVSIKAICDNIIMSNQDVQNMLDNLAKEIEAALRELNSQIQSLNSQNGLSLPTINEGLIYPSLMGMAYGIVGALVSIVYALVALIISFILALIIYLIIRKFIKEKEVYQRISKKFWYRAIGIVPNLLLGVMVGSLIISPIYYSRNIALNTLDYVNTIDLNEQFKDELNKIEEYKVKVNEYQELLNHYQEEFTKIDSNIKEVETKLDETDKKISKTNEVFTGSYYSKEKVIEEYYKTSLSGEELEECEAFVISYKSAKTEFDSSYIKYIRNKNEFNSAVSEFNDAKKQFDSYGNEIEDAKTKLENVNFDEFNTKIKDVTKYETSIKEILPDLKVFGFLVIDVGLYKIKVDGNEYTLKGSSDDVIKYLDNYIKELVEVAKDEINEIFETYDDKIKKVDEEVKKYQDEIEDKISNFDDVINEADETLKVVEKYEYEIDTYKEKINYYYPKMHFEYVEEN